MNEKKNPSNYNDLYYEEIDLYDILRKIWKWKYLILAIVIIFMLSTYFYIRSGPVTYTSESIIKIGKIANVLVEQIPDIQTYLQSGVFSESDDCAGTIKCSELDKLNKNEDKIKITSTNFSPQTSFSCMEKANNSLLNRHDMIYKKALAKINDNIASIKTKEVIDPVYFLETYNSPSSIIKKSEAPVNPDSKKTGIKLAVAFFASLFIAIFLSFFIEYFLTHRKKSE